MLFSLYTFFILIIGIGFPSISYTDAKANSHAKQYISQSHTHIQQYIDTTQKQLEVISNLISDISFLIHENQIPINHKERIIENIQTLVRDIEEKKNVLKVTSDIHVIRCIIWYTHEVMTHLRTMLDTNCASYTPFDPNDRITRGIAQTKELSADQLETILHENNILLASLEHDSHQLGLQWYNKIYRTLDKYVLRYIHEYGTLGLGIVLGTAYVSWHIFPDYFEDTWIGRPFIPSPHSNIGHDAKEHLKKVKIPGTIEQFLASFGLNLLPIGGLLTYLIKDPITTRWKAKTEPWLHKHLATFHYKMLGGSYLGKISKLDGIGKKILFDDLIGLDLAKHECQYLINYMKDPETYIRRGQRINHILFTGPPRTGKTELAKALYYEIKTLHAEQVKFIPLPAASINVFGIDRCLDIIKYHAPCIVFIDEIDLLNVQRSGKNEMLSALLQGMSGLDNDIDPTKQVIIIAATNKPEYLDFALMTHGRFGKVIHFEYPNLQERTQFFTRQFKKLGLNIPHFNVKKLARESEGKSYESLKTLIDHATLKARLAGKSLAHHHLEAALDEELNRIVPTDLKEIPDHEKEILAAHFAGHALAWQLLAPHTKLAKVTIKPVVAKLKEELMGKDLWQGALGRKEPQPKEHLRYIYGHMFTYHDHDTCNLYDMAERIKLCKIYLAGIAAEKILIGNCGYSCHCHDVEQALDIIQPFIFEGLAAETLPKTIVTAKYQQALETVAQYQEEITQLLGAHKDTLATIALELKDAQTLGADIIDEIIIDTHA